MFALAGNIDFSKGACTMICKPLIIPQIYDIAPAYKTPIAALVTVVAVVTDSIVLAIASVASAAVPNYI